MMLRLMLQPPFPTRPCTGYIYIYSPFSHLCDKLLFPGLKVLRGSRVKRVKIFANSFVFEHAECLNSFA